MQNGAKRLHFVVAFQNLILYNALTPHGNSTMMNQSCPVCKSNYIQRDAAPVRNVDDGKTIVQQSSCRSCHAQWQDEFTYTDRAIFTNT